MSGSPTSRLRTRFAPSPTGYLHLGHACSALTAYEFAKDHHGEFLLRIEDIDQGRCREEFVETLKEDLQWLGLHWPEPALRQSTQFKRYQEAIEQLSARHLTYPCFCTRRDIDEEIARSPSAPHGPEGTLYPGTCRDLAPTQQETQKQSGQPFVLRLNLERALAQLATTDLTFEERGQGPSGETGIIHARPQELGDIVLARKDIPTSYHVAVVLDDALQEITHVVRGHDLFHATHIHRVLQALWSLDPPIYRHHKLLLNDKGQRLAKRDKAETIRALRLDNATPLEVRERLHRHPTK